MRCKFFLFLIQYFFPLVIFSQSYDFELLKEYVSKDPVSRVMMAKRFVYENRNLKDYQLFVDDIKIVSSVNIFNEKAIGVNGLTATLLVGDSILLDSIFYEAVVSAYKRRYLEYCGGERFKDVLKNGKINWEIYFKLGVKERISLVKKNWSNVSKSDLCIIRLDLDNILGVITNKDVDVSSVLDVWERSVK